MSLFLKAAMSLCVAVLAANTASAAAGTAEKQWPARYHSIGAELSYNYSALGNTSRGQDNLPDYAEFGVNYRRQFKSTLSVLASLGLASPESTDSDVDIDFLRYYLSVRFHPETYQYRGWRPFAGIGLSITELEIDETGLDKSEEAFVAEVGVQHRFHDDWLVEVGARSRTEIDEGFSDLQPFVGISYLWGQSFDYSLQQRDSDGDGVPDVKDACGGTPINIEVDGIGCTVTVDSTIYQTLYVEFDSNQSTLSAEFYSDIEKLAVIMEQYPAGLMLLEGHTDNMGSDSYNMQLSYARASEVRNVLVQEFNIDPRRIEAVGAGEGQPIASNDTEQGRAANRRVEVVVSGAFSEPVKK